jgi:3-dehydrotetronate 4-kinase
MRLGAIADDFTGASDLANTLARRGMRTTLFIGVPKAGLSACEAGIIALKSRSIAPIEAVAQSLGAARALLGAGAEQILFKVCSTFDSTKEGNIGPVADALLSETGAAASIICPAFPTNGRTLYRGHLFVGDKLLNESGMENHPITPMVDANIARWLSYQSTNRVGLIGLEVVRAGVEATRQAIEKAVERKERLIICDATLDADLITLGHAAKGMALVTGGSGIALGLPDNFDLAPPVSEQGRVPRGRAVALSGSCSRATTAQVALHLETNPSFQLDVDAIIAGQQRVDDVLAWLDMEKNAALPLVYSTADPDRVRALQAQYGAELVAHAVEDFFAKLAAACVKQGFTRIISAGGETSSAIVSALGIDALTIGPEIDPGVPVVVSEGQPALALALKSGNFGAPDFFQKALKVMQDAG